MTSEFYNPWSTLFLQLSMHQCCITSTFESSIFTYLLSPFARNNSFSLMRFFPHAVKQSLLVIELKREIKEKEEDRKFKQEACSYWSQIYFYCRSKKSIYLINFYWLTYIKKVKDKMSNTKYRNNASESKEDKSPKLPTLVCFIFVYIKTYVIDFYK